ncbi:YvrJ family protein [Solibacillus sp. CAU 1738]|uniref:YvrJ family protein n=1 Tax=Solibacillus sp. CAU 1738 TaxID=3140363 RepID=UPI00326035B8
MPAYEHLFNFVNNLGFPIVVSLYLLHRFERKIGELEQAIKGLIQVIEPYKSKSKE